MEGRGLVVVPDWFMRVCAGCGAELPDRGYFRRRVPWSRGRRPAGRMGDVCGSCAERIDAQGTLDVQPSRRKRIVL